MCANTGERLRKGSVLKRMRGIALVSASLVATSLLAQDSEQVDREESFEAAMIRVYVAIRNADLDALRDTMGDSFSSSFGGDGSVSEGIASFRDPERRQLLLEALRAGCAHREYANGAQYYVCPPAFQEPGVVYFWYRAGFRYSEGRWIFDFFLAGD